MFYYECIIMFKYQYKTDKEKFNTSLDICEIIKPRRYNAT